MFRKVALVEKIDLEPIRRVVIERVWFRFAAIQDLEKQIRASQAFLGSSHSLPLEFVSGFAEPGGIEQTDRYPAEINHFLDCISRGAGLLADDRAIVTEQAVEQTRLAGIRWTVDHGANAFAQNPAL